MSECLVKHGWRSVVISSGGRLETRLIRNGSKHITLPVHTKNPFRWSKLKKNIEKVFFEEKPNIIHVRSRVPSWTAGKVAKKMNIPLVSTIHGSYVANSIFKRFYNSASIKADKIIAISNYIKDNILKNNPEHAKKYLKERCPLGRFGEIDEFSPVVAYYCSKLVSFAHGSIIGIDGGQSKHFLQYNYEP